jgi:hypothetical protein
LRRYLDGAKILVGPRIDVHVEAVLLIEGLGASTSETGTTISSMDEPANDRTTQRSKRYKRPKTTTEPPREGGQILRTPCSGQTISGCHSVGFSVTQGVGLQLEARSDLTQAGTPSRCYQMACLAASVATEMRIDFRPLAVSAPAFDTSRLNRPAATSVLALSRTRSSREADSCSRSSSVSASASAMSSRAASTADLVQGYGSPQP